MQVPLFPLHTVLFPGGPLPLRIFEARYIDMVRDCLRDEAPFGVVLIREGQETGPATMHDVGTLAHIRDWYQGSDGILGVTAVGESRFRLLDSRRLDNGLNVGQVESLPAEPPMPLPEAFQPLSQILADVLDDLGRLYETLDRKLDDAGWVGSRFVEILPLDLAAKQACLEKGDAMERLRIITALLDKSEGWPEINDA